MGLKDHKALSQEAVTKDVLLNISKETAPAPNASMESMRKLVLTQFSPLRMVSKKKTIFFTCYKTKKNKHRVNYN